MIRSLTASDYSAVNPLPTPADWVKPAGSSAIQVLVTSGENLFGRTSETSIIYSAISLAGQPVIGGKFRIPTVSGNIAGVKGMALLNNSGNGYGCVYNGSAVPGATLQIRAVISGVLQEAVLYSVPAVATSNGHLCEMYRDQSTGGMTIYQDGSLMNTGGTPYVNNTYTDVEFSGILLEARTGRLTYFEVFPEVSSVLTITDPIRLGGAVSGTLLTGVYADGAADLEINGVVASVTIAADAFGGTMPAMSEGLLLDEYLPVSLPATLDQGLESHTKNSTLDVPSGSSVVEFGTQIDEPDYLLADVPIESGDRAYYETNQPTVGTVEIFPDGSVYTDEGGVVTFFLHKMGDPLVEYNVTAPAGGGEVAPVMPADASVTIDAGTTAVGTYAATSGTEPIAYTLTGTDAADFSVSSTAVLTFTGPAVVGSYAVNVVGTNDYGTDSTAVSVTVDAVVGEPTIDSVGTIRIGGTAAVTVSGFSGAVNAGTYDGIALVSASNTEIQFVGLVNGEVTQRPGVRELTLTDGTDSDTIDQVGYAPSGWSSYTITAEFTESLNGVPGTYLPAGWAEGDFILTPSTSSASDMGISTGLNGTQELFLVDAVTGLATSFEVTTTGGGGGVATTGLGMRGLTMIGL